MSREGLDETAETRKLKRLINLFSTEKEMRIRKKGDDKRSSKTDAVRIPKGKITVKSRLLSNLGTKKFHPSRGVCIFKRNESFRVDQARIRQRRRYMKWPIVSRLDKGEGMGKDANNTRNNFSVMPAGFIDPLA